MKLSCNVARDLLPLYHDGVCSGESCELVEAHLKDCPDCAAILQELRGEIELSHEAPNDGAVLKKLERNVRKGKKRAWLRGAAAVLAMVLLIAAGGYGWWYLDTRAFYEQYTEGHQPHFGTNLYQWTSGDYQFQVVVPEKPGDGGSRYVNLIREENTVNIVPGEVVNVWLNFGKDEAFEYLVGIEVRTRPQSSEESLRKVEVWTEYLVLDQNLNLLYPDYLDEEDRTRQDRILEDFFPDIMGIIEAARNEWPFLSEK